MKPENSRRVETLLAEVASILRAEDMVRGGEWTFKGWTADERPVAHKVKIDGYERTGLGVEKERLARAQATAGVAPPPTTEGLATTPTSPETVPKHLRVMAQAVLHQLGQAHPREELDLDAVRALATAIRQ